MNFEPTLSDEELMLAYVHGDYEAFEYLYQRHSKKIFGYIMMKVKDNEETQEIFQTVFRKLHQSRCQYKSEMPVLPWLFTICKNSIIDNRRMLTKKQEHFTSTDNIESMADKHQINTSDQGQVEDVPGFSTLNKKEQEVIKLKYTEQLDFKEISERLGYSEANSRKISSRAINKLKRLLKREYVK